MALKTKKWDVTEFLDSEERIALLSKPLSSLWSSLKWSIVEDTLDSRFGTVWLLRAIAWAALGVVLLAYLKIPRARRWLTPLLALPAIVLLLPVLALCLLGRRR